MGFLEGLIEWLFPNTRYWVIDPPGEAGRENRRRKKQPDETAAPIVESDEGQHF